MTALADACAGLFSHSVDDDVTVTASFPESNPFGRERNPSPISCLVLILLRSGSQR